MADAGEPVLLKGKDLNDYRVVDLKKECDKRGLSKAGNKQEIVERLRVFLREEQQKENKKANDEDGGDASNVDTGQNDVVKSYLQKQKKLLEDRQQEIRRFSEESASEDNESPTKKDKPALPEEKENEKASKDVGAGDTRSSRRRSNSSNHSNADENVSEVTSPQQRPRRGWRKSSKEEPSTDAPKPDEGKTETKTKDPVEEKKSAATGAAKKRSNSSSSERSTKNSPQRTRQRSESGSSSDRSRSKKKRSSRASSSSSSSGSRDRSPRRRKSRSRSSSSSRSRSRSRSPRRRSASRSVSPANKGSVQSKAQNVKRKSRSRSRSPPSKRRSRSSSSRSRSRSPSPAPKQKNPPMDDTEPVSTTTKDSEAKESVATIEKEDEQPDTTVEPVTDKEVDGDHPQTSDISPDKSVQRIPTAEDEKGEGEKSEDKENQKEKPVRKRKWGSKTGNRTAGKRISSINISTDSLKGIIPDIKLTEPVLDLGNDDDKISDIEEDKRDVKIRRTVVVKADEQKEDLEEGEAPDSPEEGEAGDQEDDENKNMEVDKDQRKVKEVKAEPVIIRRVSQKKPLIETEEPSKVKSRSPSPARNAVSTIVHVRNLVRPFTVIQLKELLKRHGTLVDEKFWIDSIKSHCYATYETEEQAVEARKALHGTKWPSSNPKILQVDYATPDEIEYHKNEEEAPRLAREKALKEAKARKEEEKKRKAEREARLAKKKEEEAKKRAAHVREWDRDKIRQSEERDEVPKKRRPSSESPVKDKRRRERSREKEKDRPAKKEKTEKKDEEEPPAKLLDDLFKKTKATPCIYWLPLTEAQAAEKAKQREAERERRLKEREKRKSEPSPPHRPMERERRPMRSPPQRGRMDDWSRRRSPDRRPQPDMRDRRR